MTPLKRTFCCCCTDVIPEYWFSETKWTRGEPHWATGSPESPCSISESRAFLVLVRVDVRGGAGEAEARVFLHPETFSPQNFLWTGLSSFALVYPFTLLGVDLKDQKDNYTGFFGGVFLKKNQLAQMGTSRKPARTCPLQEVQEWFTHFVGSSGALRARPHHGASFRPGGNLKGGILCTPAQVLANRPLTTVHKSFLEESN